MDAQMTMTRVLRCFGLFSISTQWRTGGRLSLLGRRLLSWNHVESGAQGCKGKKVGTSGKRVCFGGLDTLAHFVDQTLTARPNERAAVARAAAKRRRPAHPLVLIVFSSLRRQRRAIKWAAQAPSSLPFHPLPSLLSLGLALSRSWARFALATRLRP